MMTPPALTPGVDAIVGDQAILAMAGDDGDRWMFFSRILVGSPGPGPNSLFRTIASCTVVPSRAGICWNCLRLLTEMYSCSWMLNVAACCASDGVAVLPWSVWPLQPWSGTAC